MRHLILNLHGIGTPIQPLEPGEDQYWISRSFFEDSLKLVQSVSNYANVSFTFDDGNLSDLVIGADLLNLYGWKAEIFVLSDRIGHTGYLGISEIRELCRMGHVIGSHGARHVNWTRLDAEGRKSEFDDAREKISAASELPVTSAAIPFGAYNGAVLRHLQARGYHQVYSSDGGDCTFGQYPIPRTSLRADMALTDVERILVAPESPLRRWRRTLVRTLKRRL